MKKYIICEKESRVFIFMKISFLVVLTCLFVGSCKSEYVEDTSDLLLSVDFDKNKESAFTGNATDELVFSAGVKGDGLNLKDCISVPALKNADTTWVSNVKDFSVSVWVKSAKVTPDTTIILSNSDFSKKNAGIYGQRRTNKGITLYSYNGAWGWNIGNGVLHYLYEPIAEAQRIAYNKWHQIVFTYSSSLKEVRLFYDGINKAVLHIGDLDNRNFISDLPLRIGGDENVPPSYMPFQGTIDELQVWGKTLSHESIRRGYKRFF